MPSRPSRRYAASSKRAVRLTSRIRHDRRAERCLRGSFRPHLPWTEAKRPQLQTRKKHSSVYQNMKSPESRGAESAANRPRFAMRPAMRLEMRRNAARTTDRECTANWGGVQKLERARNVACDGVRRAVACRDSNLTRYLPNTCDDTCRAMRGGSQRTTLQHTALHGARSEEGIGAVANIEQTRMDEAAAPSDASRKIGRGRARFARPAHLDAPTFALDVADRSRATRASRPLRMFHVKHPFPS